jgi:MYXO-CTERM domain-containing protein
MVPHLYRRPRLRRAAALLTLALAPVAACQGPGPDAGDSDPANGALRGELTSYILDRDDGTSDTQYFLQLRDGSQRRLIFDRDPGLDPYARLSVRGRTAADGFAVSSFALDENATPGVRTSPLIGAAPATPRKFAFILIDTGAGVNVTADTARQKLFDANFFMVGQGSIRRYYQEESYGVTDITGDVYGPLMYTPTTTCDTQGVTSLRAQVDTLAGGPSDHYLWYFGSNQGCNFTGLAQEGTPQAPRRDTWYHASTNCVVLVQEPGHNFGMQHSSSMVCPGGVSFVDAPDGMCTHNEYGDRFDPMGGGCRHMNGWQKSFEGWLAGCNSVRVTSTGTFTLFPIETPCNGIQVLQVAMPHTRPFSHSGGGSTRTTTDTLTSYYVELRSPAGFDQGINTTVLIHVAGDYRMRTQSGLHTWLLDMTPNTTSLTDAALAAGQTFNDPAGGLSITNVSADATHAQIQVTVANGTGDPTCLDGTTLMAPGPTSCGGAGGSVVVGGGGAGGAAGAGGRGGAGGSSGGTDGGIAVLVPDAGSDLKGTPGAVNGGCSCTLSDGHLAEAPFVLVLFVAPVLARRRRR